MSAYVYATACVRQRVRRIALDGSLERGDRVGDREAVLMVLSAQVEMVSLGVLRWSTR